MRKRRESVSRRQIVRGLAATGAAAVLRLPTRAIAAEAALETTKLTLYHSLSICQAPQYVAEERPANCRSLIRKPCSTRSTHLPPIPPDSS